MMVTEEIKRLARADVERLFTGPDKLRVYDTDEVRFYSAIGERCFHSLFPWAEDVRQPGGGSLDYYVKAEPVDVKTFKQPGFAWYYNVFLEPARVDPDFHGTYAFMFYDERAQVCWYVGKKNADAFLKECTRYEKGDLLPRAKTPLNGPRLALTVGSLWGVEV